MMHTPAQTWDEAVFDGDVNATVDFKYANPGLPPEFADLIAAMAGRRQKRTRSRKVTTYMAPSLPIVKVVNGTPMKVVSVDPKNVIEEPGFVAWRGPTDPNDEEYEKDAFDWVVGRRGIAWIQRYDGEDGIMPEKAIREIGTGRVVTLVLDHNDPSQTLDLRSRDFMVQAMLDCGVDVTAHPRSDIACLFDPTRKKALLPPEIQHLHLRLDICLLNQFALESFFTHDPFEQGIIEWREPVKTEGGDIAGQFTPARNF